MTDTTARDPQAAPDPTGMAGTGEAADPVAELAKEAALEAIRRAGLTPDFIGRPDGLPGLRGAYGLRFAEVRALLPAVKYQALAAGEVDVIDGYSTDGFIARYDLVVLRDDRRFFPPYEAAALIGRRLAEQRPDAVAALTELGGRDPSDLVAHPADQRRRRGVRPHPDARLGRRGAVQRVVDLLREALRDRDDRVDSQCCPVLGSADIQGPVGRDEEVVVDQEAADDADDAGEEATRSDADHDRHDKHQRGRGDAEMVAQRQHPAGQHERAGQRRGDAEQSATGIGSRDYRLLRKLAHCPSSLTVGGVASGPCIDGELARVLERFGRPFVLRSR